MQSCLDPLAKAVFYALSFQLGILPIEPGQPVKPALAQLPPDEARRVRRKFRKEWKRQQKRRGEALGSRTSRKRRQEEAMYSWRGHPPDAKQMWHRKVTVFSRLAAEAEDAVERTVHKRGARAPP